MPGPHQDTAVVIDSSGWLEYFADGPNAGDFAAAIESADPLVVPTLALFEVYKRLHLQRGEEVALQAVNAMQGGLVAGLDAATAIAAARASLEHRLPLADSVMLATAQAHAAVLWTQDADFAGIPGVRYLAKR